MVFVPLVLQLLLWGAVLSDNLFFDKYGNCVRQEPFDLTSENHLVRSVGGGYNHETMNCRLLFRAPPENGICVTFKAFFIDDCGVSLIVYRSNDRSNEREWKKFSCKDNSPSQMCTSNQYVTLQVKKERLNQNKGYQFEISVEKSSSISQSGVLVASLGVIIGIIVGVVVLLTVLAFIIFYCCWRRPREEEIIPNKSLYHDESHAQPSAPPAPPDMNAPLMPPVAMCPPFETYTPPDPPPPYEEHTVPVLTNEAQVS